MLATYSKRKSENEALTKNIKQLDINISNLKAELENYASVQPAQTNNAASE